MDFISQVVATKEDVELRGMRRNLDELSMKTEHLESKLSLQLERKVKLPTKSQYTISLFRGDIEKLLNSVLSLREHLIHVKSKNISILEESEFTITSKRIDDIKDTLIFLENIVQIDQLITASEQDLILEPLTACQTLLQVKQIINNNYGKGFRPYIEHAMMIVVSHLTNNIVKAFHKWNKSVKFETFQTGAETKCSEFSLMLDSEVLSQSFQILCLMEEPIMIGFSQRFLDDIFKPVLLNSFSLNLKCTSRRLVLIISYAEKSRKMLFSTVLTYLIKIFQMLNSYLNVKGVNGASLIEELGANCSEQLTTLLIEHHMSCFDEDRDTIIQLTNQLINTMSEHCFIKSDDLKRLSYYLGDQNDSICFLSTIQLTSEAMKLIKTDLLSTFLAESVELSDPSQDLTVSSRCSDSTMNATRIISLHHRKYIFPQCCVSTSMKELVDLICRIAEDTESPLDPAQYTKLIYDILQTYLDFRHLDEPSPKQSALIYNNSMYLIMKMVLIDKSIPLCGFVPKLEAHGFDELDHCIANQENTLGLALLDGLVDLRDKEELPESWNIAVHSSLKQLSSLQNDWFGVLSSDIYGQAIGYLCCKFLDKIISEVLSCNRIASKVQSDLSKLTSFITQQIPLKFRDVSSPEQYVRSWSKWCELQEILLGDLFTIKAKWTDGSLPLHFNSMEIRCLISSLFPHSDTRLRIIAAII